MYMRPVFKTLAVVTQNLNQKYLLEFQIFSKSFWNITCRFSHSVEVINIST